MLKAFLNNLEHTQTAHGREQQGFRTRVLGVSGCLRTQLGEAGSIHARLLRKPSMNGLARHAKVQSTSTRTEYVFIRTGTRGASGRSFPPGTLSISRPVTTYY